MNIKFTLKQVAALAATVLSSSKLTSRIADKSVAIEEAFKQQAKMDGVVGKSTVTFGSVSVLKTLKKHLDDDDASVVAALWALVISVNKSEKHCMADLREAAASAAAPTGEAEIAALINRTEAAFAAI